MQPILSWFADDQIHSSAVQQDKERKRQYFEM
jgi:hypothetical protein